MFDFWRRREEDRLVDAFEQRSRSFIAAYRAADPAQMVLHSRRAWAAYEHVAAAVRHGTATARIDSADLDVATSAIIDELQENDAGFIASARRLTVDHPAYRAADLRQTLYRLGRSIPTLSYFRIDDDDRHHIIRGGCERGREDGFWVMEVEIARLCANLRRALMQA